MVEKNLGKKKVTIALIVLYAKKEKTYLACFKA